MATEKEVLKKITELVTVKPSGENVLKGNPVAWGGIGGSGKHAADLTPESVAWGGIGGSGKHATELLPEVELLFRDPNLRENLLVKGGQVAWGGIGGSGKHAAELEPEILEGKE